MRSLSLVYYHFESRFKPRTITSLNPTSKDTGLAYDIVTKGHDEEMEVESMEGEGTEYVVKLPVSQQLRKRLTKLRQWHIEINWRHLKKLPKLGNRFS